MLYLSHHVFARRSPRARLRLLTSLLLLLLIGCPVGAQTQRSRWHSQSHNGKAKPLTAKDHRAAEARLAELGYWTGPVDGRWDEASRHALVALQKVEGLRRTGQLTPAVFAALMKAERPKSRESGPAHIEVDLIRQVLFVVDDTGQVTHVLPVSTGSGKEFVSEGWARDAITHPGRYQVRDKLPGWKESPLGRLYYPVYFMWGTAIHGYPSVPITPASHGCVRIPMVAARSFYEMIPMGMPVIIYREPLRPRPVAVRSTP